MIARLHEGRWAIVEIYVGLDVSDKSTHLCVVDGSGGDIPDIRYASVVRVNWGALDSGRAGLARTGDG